MPDYQLKGKRALVTGVSRKKGIGAAISRSLAKEGADVFTSYFRPYDATTSWGGSPEDAGAILEELRRMNVMAAGLEVDLGKPEAANGLMDAAVKFLGGVDILVCNAAVSSSANVEHIDPELLDLNYGVNLRSTLLLCSEFLKRHAENKGGSIILLTSGQGEGGMGNEIPYIVSKAGLDAFVMNAHQEFARKGITLNAVDPGCTDSGWMTKEQYKDAKEANPMGRVGAPEDAARLIVFLASSQANWITGQVIRSKGGGW